MGLILPPGVTMLVRFKLSVAGHATNAGTNTSGAGGFYLQHTFQDNAAEGLSKARSIARYFFALLGASFYLVLYWRRRSEI